MTTENVRTGFDFPYMCSVTYYTESGATLTDTVNALCGFNKDSKFYCPWQMGDAGIQGIIQNIRNVLPIANKNCGAYIEKGYSQMYLCSYMVKHYPEIVRQSLFISNIISNPNFGAYIANNPACVTKSLTNFLGSKSSTIYSALFSLLIGGSLLLL